MYFTFNPSFKGRVLKGRQETKSIEAIRHLSFEDKLGNPDMRNLSRGHTIKLFRLKTGILLPSISMFYASGRESDQGSEEEEFNVGSYSPNAYSTCLHL